MKTSDFKPLVESKDVSIVGKTGKNNSESWIIKHSGQIRIQSNLMNYY